MRRAFVLSAAHLVAACASTPPDKPPVEATPIVGAAQAAGAILYAWTQVVPGGTLARAVVEGPGQPTVLPAQKTAYLPACHVACCRRRGR